jgi:large subunit ribosomal protein L20
MRVKRGVAKRKRHKKYLKAAKGYNHTHSHRFRSAKDQVEKAMQYSTRDRKQKQRIMRRLWTTRIGLACRMNGISYSKFIFGLKTKNIQIDRRMLQLIAREDSATFSQLAETSKSALAG